VGFLYLLEGSLVFATPFAGWAGLGLLLQRSLRPRWTFAGIGVALLLLAWTFASRYLIWLLAMALIVEGRKAFERARILSAIVLSK
jgi:hypothetical protein